MKFNTRGMKSNLRTQNIRVMAVPFLAVLFAFMVVWTYGYRYVRENSFRDPSSKFYDIAKGHTQRYSHVRRLEAEQFIDEHSEDLTFRRNITNNGDKPFMCVGIPTMARKGVRYFRDCVGSLLHGLDERERQQIYLMPFFAQSNATMHPAFSEKWVENLSDSILEYDGAMVNIDEIRQMEKESNFIRKGLVDYVFLLKKCRDTGAEYITILEDDVLALHGWFHRAKHALDVAWEKTHLRGETTFTYLRLFWTEEYLGWVREHQNKHTFWVTVTFVGVAVTCFAIRGIFPPSKKILNIWVVVLLVGFCTPMAIYLVFAAGRSNSVGLGTGVQEMNAFGCCGQGMAIPKSMVHELVEWYEGKGVGFIDSLTEEFADKTGHLRWALFPSILQHMGTKSSKDVSDRKVSYNRIWNHAFEMNDFLALKEEHEREVESWDDD